MLKVFIGSYKVKKILEKDGKGFKVLGKDMRVLGIGCYKNRRVIRRVLGEDYMRQ